MMLTPNFSLAEFLHSETASRRGIDNTPPADVLDNLKKTAAMMEEVRTALGGKPIFISSGYRSPALNEAVGGSPNSAHMSGEAVDFTCPAFGGVPQIVAAISLAGVPFDQLIREFVRPPSGGWCHIGFRHAGTPRGQVLDIG